MRNFQLRYREKESLTQIQALKKCCGGLTQRASEAGIVSKTDELMEFLRMNDRILRFKKRTVRNVDEINHKQAS
jgi:hypothetical protein